MEKYYNEKEEVAVLISKGYGAGWSTWLNHCFEETDLLFNPELVKLVIKKNEIELSERTEKSEVGQKAIKEVLEEIEAKALELLRDEDVCTFGGAKGLYVEWIKPTTLFRVVEVGGYETLLPLVSHKWFQA